ncbi:MAG: hypothetical protein COA37_15030 [Hoeflea sp.]|uniref:thioesterase family protein n=1 Tax=Hoeflea sp. TaxID=1940281 RepID=UPI000C0EF598|nr:thioesterase family protein [Hoeflea sp.]PHR20686.1 MAG: hypothetical protein COA37_15030 [Hoeflea sp.]
MQDDLSLLTLPRSELIVSEDWIDDNRHMNAAYYTVAVKDPALLAHDSWDYGRDFRRRSNQSNFVYNAQVVYLRELLLGDRLAVTTLLKETDGKRIRLLFEIYNADQDYLAALVQYLVIHVDLGPPPRAVNMPDPLAARLRRVQAAHAGYPLPPEADRLLAMPLKPR